jgi:hypothetical protein
VTFVRFCKESSSSSRQKQLSFSTQTPIIAARIPVSYHLDLFRPIPDQDPLDTAAASLETKDQSERIDPAKEAKKQKNANALIAHNPRLEIFKKGLRQDRRKRH